MKKDRKNRITRRPTRSAMASRRWRRGTSPASPAIWEGRRKRPKSIQERFDRELRRKVAVREDGKVRKIEKIDLWVRSVIVGAIKGDHRASRILVNMLAASDEEIARGVAEQTLEDLTAEDRDILERHLAQLSTAAASDENETSG